MLLRNEKDFIGLERKGNNLSTDLIGNLKSKDTSPQSDNKKGVGQRLDVINNIYIGEFNDLQLRLVD